MSTAVLDKPIRVGIFSTMSQADQAVAGLLAAGFTKEQITVICSDRTIEEHFHDYEHQQPASTKAPKAVQWGAEIGAAVGGLASLASVATAAGFAAIAMVPITIPAGAVFGGMIGAMVLQGQEKELAEFYEQAVEDGMILVAAEAHGDGHEEKLAASERAFREAGTEPFSLDEG